VFTKSMERFSKYQEYSVEKSHIGCEIVSKYVYKWDCESISHLTNQFCKDELYSGYLATDARLFNTLNYEARHKNVELCGKHSTLRYNIYFYYR
jgi:hypothetical protein